ncbi:MAG: cytochrome b/b6 domain-containing protein [Proteobacteria bacterium]|nr:cytochrome b/b6 domain-containing protein [Pseudomonadota bacterium]
MQTEPTISTPAWDVPVRLFHWALVLLVLGSVVTGLIGGNAMVWHMRFGSAILALVLFRVLWGVLGSSTARFSDFLYGPRRVLAFTAAILQRREAPYLGHNPLGGWMVLVLLAVLLFQASSGLFANDDIATEGPLYALIGKDLSDRLTSLHKLNVKLLYALVAVHVAAVLFHWFGRGENLVRPMISSCRPMHPACRRVLPVPGVRPCLRF